MANIGKIYLGGRNAGGSAHPEVVNGAVAFQLNQPSNKDDVYYSEDAKWVAEIKTGQRTIVARTKTILSRNDIVRIGFEQAQRAIDIFAFELNLLFTISDPGDSHIVLFLRDGDLVVQHVDVSNLAFTVHADIEVRDKDGNLVPPPPSPPCVWSAPLRYFRLSQTANDLYEAYRNAFLALESLLNSISPKTRSEGEKQWLLRALQVVSAKADLRQFVPARTTDPAGYIMTAQYEQTRCRLFHGKGELPATYEGSVNPEDVASAYGQLIRIWREIAQKHLPVRVLGGGAVTYTGFRMMMDRAFASNLSAFYTDDTSPPRGEDTEISPLGRNVHPFSEVRYLSETSPGHVSFVATQKFSPSRKPTMVHRICSKVKDALFATSFIDDGVFPDDVDTFESFQTVRLLNKQQPRTSFAGQGGVWGQAALIRY